MAQSESGNLQSRQILRNVLNCDPHSVEPSKVKSTRASFSESLNAY